MSFQSGPTNLSLKIVIIIVRGFVCQTVRFYFSLSVCLSEFMWTICMQMPMEARRGSESPWNWSYGVGEGVVSHHIGFRNQTWVSGRAKSIHNC